MRIEVSEELVGFIDEYEGLINSCELDARELHRYTELPRVIASRMTIALSCARSLEKAMAELEDKMKEAASNADK